MAPDALAAADAKVAGAQLRDLAAAAAAETQAAIVCPSMPRKERSSWCHQKTGSLPVNTNQQTDARRPCPRRSVTPWR
jgi:hypothetical protein